MAKSECDIKRLTSPVRPSLRRRNSSLIRSIAFIVLSALQFSTPIETLPVNKSRRPNRQPTPTGLVERIAILTGRGEDHYALGLASGLVSEGVSFDFIASDALESQELRSNPRVRVLSLRGDTRPQASFAEKITRVARYYARLLRYAATAHPRIFHILWNNEVEWFDRTLLMLYYRLCGRRVVLTAHNVNTAARDGKDGPLNRLTLRIQYALAAHLFVHTEAMRRELEAGFGVPANKVTVIPFGINGMVPNTSLTAEEARSRLGLGRSHKVLLFFGNIAPYKGLEFLVRAMGAVGSLLPESRLVIAGQPKGSELYWSNIRQEIRSSGLEDRVVFRIGFVEDTEVEIYFKAADVLVLPYTSIYQSGVLFLGYNFGLPAIVSDVGSFRQDVEEGSTGLVCRPEDPKDLAEAIRRFFGTDMYEQLESRRAWLRQLMTDRHSWEDIGATTKRVYQMLGGSQ